MDCLGDQTVLDFAEGRLAGPRRARALEHLDACELCRQLVAYNAAAMGPSATFDSKPSDAGSPRAEGDRIAIGQSIGNYRIDALLGGGAMGNVYAAEHRRLRRKVALKILHCFDESETAREQRYARVFREARAASAVRHDNVVSVHDVFTLADGRPIIVMDLVEGETLRKRLDRETTLSTEATLHLLTEILDALEATHRAGVVHRDLKPSNIIVAGAGEDPTVRLVDFGLAKLSPLHDAEGKSQALTHPGMLIGTPQYMAPEQAFGDSLIDARADLWAVGAIAYECLSGRRAIEVNTVGQMLRRLATLEITPLASLAPNAPKALTDLVHGLLQERDRRPESARQVQALLQKRHLLSDDSAVHAKASDPSRLSNAAPLSDSTAPVRLQSETPIGQNRRLSQAALALGALTLIAWASLAGSDSEPVSGRADAIAIDASAAKRGASRSAPPEANAVAQTSAKQAPGALAEPPAEPAPERADLQPAPVARPPFGASSSPLDNKSHPASPRQHMRSAKNATTSSRRAKARTHPAPSLTAPPAHSAATSAAKDQPKDAIDGRPRGPGKLLLKTPF